MSTFLKLLCVLLPSYTEREYLPKWLRAISLAATCLKMSDKEDQLLLKDAAAIIVIESGIRKRTKLKKKFSIGMSLDQSRQSPTACPRQCGFAIQYNGGMHLHTSPQS